MSFKELEQKHNLVNMLILACGKHPTDADINPLLEERLERFYEDAVIEGMAKQMHSSVDRAVNTMGKEWVSLSDRDITGAAHNNAKYPVSILETTDSGLCMQFSETGEWHASDKGNDFMKVNSFLMSFAKALEAKLKELNT